MSIRNVLPALVIATVAALSATALWSQAPVPTTETAASIAFRNAVVPAPKKTTTPVFKLSHNYPHSIPEKCEKCVWLNIPVNFATQFPSGSKTIESPKWHGQHWDEYINAILDYVKEDQDPQLANEVGWRPPSRATRAGSTCRGWPTIPPPAASTCTAPRAHGRPWRVPPNATTGAARSVLYGRREGILQDRISLGL